MLLPYLVDWDSDLILRHARGELQVAGEGFHVPSGVLHAPGTALTLELQEDSDVLSMFQALNAGRIISKELLFKDVRPEDREAHGERFPLRFVDWEVNGDPWFHENRHLTPLPVDGDGVRGLGLLQHQQVRREAARPPAGRHPPPARAGRLQRLRVGRVRHLRRARGPGRRAGARRAGGRP